MTADPALKMDITQVGTMTSIFPIAYGFSKFISGVLGARTSPRIMLAGGLMATAVINIMFGFGHSMVWFCSWWALNGILQVLLMLQKPCLLLQPPCCCVAYCSCSKSFNLWPFAGIWGPLLCSYFDLLVCNQGARHILGYVEHCTQPWRFQCAHLGRKRSALLWMEVGYDHCTCSAALHALMMRCHL